MRSQFIEKHIDKLVSALRQGVTVFGYLYWSLIDNFEWAIGTQARFGLAAVDFNTQERIERPCVQVFKRVCVENAWGYDELGV